jgi:hypothetical protein
MFLLETLSLSFAIAFLRGGRIGKLADVHFRWPWLLLLALFLKFSVYFPFGESYSYFVSTYSALRHLLSYALVVSFLFVNLDLKGFVLIPVGTLLNLLAIAFNGGFMPASRASLVKSGLGELVPLYLQNGGHWNNSILMGPGTRLSFLGDVFYLPLPAPFYSVFSIGDIVIAIGALLFVQRAMVGRSFVWFWRRSLATRSDNEII